ncbi:extracellular solute-binding protein [Proteinivorax tanatarense]|uniref:Extracellular solute-binding protein n=1 Tax=Proteinivorax tanatarense TaxID=1260629 RepID=A0AAU7VMY8_9FIRM
MKIFRLIVCFFLFFILTGCQNDLPDPVEPDTEITLEIWETYNEDEQEVFLDIIEEFKKENPNISIELNSIGHGKGWEELQKGLAMGNLPDIAFVDMKHISALAEAGAIVNLNYLGADELAEQLISSAVKSNTYGGGIFGLPQKVETKVLYYNKTLFDEANVSYPTEEWTWDNLINFSKPLTKNNNYGYGMGNSLEETLPKFYSYGAELTNDSQGQFTLDSEAGLKALELKNSLCNEYQVAAGAWKDDFFNPREGFVQQKYGMIIDSSERFSFYDEKLELGVEMVPKGTYGSVSSIQGDSMVILKDSDYPHEAYEFVKFLTSAEIQTLWFEQLGSIPVNKEALNAVSTDDNFDVILKQATQTQPRLTVPQYNVIEDIVNEKISLVLKGEKTPEQALKEATEKVNNKLFN